MSSFSVAPQKLFGLLELDQRGTVIFSKLEGDEKLARTTDVVGRNFFSEVAPFLNVAEFRQRFDSFDNNSEPSNSFMFDCDYEDGAVPVRVLLARLREDAKYAGSVLVYIKKADVANLLTRTDKGV
jgi:photoactive yellow protein